MKIVHDFWLIREKMQFIVVSLTMSIMSLLLYFTGFLYEDDRETMLKVGFWHLFL